ncbi:cytochrome P450 [Tricholoma matsutake]|nr:cytochrome P450 [Tricholoma matsutake 945]
MSILNTIGVIVLCITLVAFIRSKLIRTQPDLLPPGPPKDSWLFGNSIPKIYPYRKFEQWTQQYGSVFSLRQGTEIIIVIGRLQAAIHIMEREGAYTLDRPRSISAGETLSGGMRTVLMPAGERFKKMRRALHAHLQPKIVQSYAPILMRSARQHILDILAMPDKHQDHAKRYSSSVVMALAYGKVPKSYDDPDVVAVNRCLTRLGSNLRPGLWQVDIYPFLRYIPGYLKELREGHKEELTLFKTQLDQVRSKMVRNEPTPDSFGKYLLERQPELDLSDDQTAYLAGSIFGAGSDTTAAAISIGVLAAACYPEAQKRVQEELDAVLGSERAPTIADQDMLPQTQAFVLETFRWRPVTAGGFAHKSTKDLIWKDYLIPKGSTLIGNVWSIGRDPAFFPDPESFNPQRWISENQKIRDDLKSFTFGFGRRVCPGQYIASASVFLNTALLQWAFKIKKEPQHPIDELAFTQSANTHPLPFRVVFEPRAAATVDGIRELIEEYGS